ncbi:MAG: hypothetical protein RR313_10980 [Anaerovoracaceae bacterium]
MTWMDLYLEICKQCSCRAHADDIIGHLMDDYGSWDWDAIAPEGAGDILR